MSECSTPEVQISCMDNPFEFNLELEDSERLDEKADTMKQLKLEIEEEKPISFKKYTKKMRSQP